MSIEPLASRTVILCAVGAGVLGGALGLAGATLFLDDADPRPAPPSAETTIDLTGIERRLAALEARLPEARPATAPARIDRVEDENTGLEGRILALEAVLKPEPSRSVEDREREQTLLLRRADTSATRSMEPGLRRANQALAAALRIPHRERFLELFSDDEEACDQLRGLVRDLQRTSQLARVVEAVEAFGDRTGMPTWEQHLLVLRSFRASQTGWRRDVAIEYGLRVLRDRGAPRTPERARLLAHLAGMLQNAERVEQARTVCDAVIGEFSGVDDAAWAVGEALRIRSAIQAGGGR